MDQTARPTMTSGPSFARKYVYSMLWALFILFACGASTGTLMELHLGDLFGYDKPIHMFLFGMQAWLIIRARLRHEYGYRFMQVVGAACLLSALYGVLIEVMQKLVFTGRAYDYFDMIANALGCVIVYGWFWRKRKQFAQ
jgi:hypothetical protein